MNDIITRVEVQYEVDNRLNCAVYEKAEGILSLSFPKFDDEAKMIFTTKENGETEISFGTFRKIAENRIDELTRRERQDAAILLNGDNPNFELDQITVTTDRPPRLTVTDVTESVLLAFPPISQEVLDGKDQGIWSQCGERLLCLELNRLPFQDDDLDMSVNFTQIDAEKLKEKDSKDLASPVLQMEKNPNRFLCPIDTNKIGKLFTSYELQDSTRAVLAGQFTLEKHCASGDLNSSRIILPFSIQVNNTDFSDTNNPYTCIDTRTSVAIDFGTSSTCCAINEEPIRLIEMSPDIDGTSNDSSYRTYENPTYLKLYRYDLLREKWKDSRAHSHPLLRRQCSDEEYAEYSPSVMEFGHKAKGDQAKDKRTIESIISELKMLPKLEADGKESVCVPFYVGNDTVKSVHLTANEHEKGEGYFDPIEFYGYLLGRAINYPGSLTGKYYTKYLLTFPVKFDEPVRERIRQSLSRGILRSLPQYVSGMKDANGNQIAKVTMKMSEPVACIGAACGNELTLGENDEARLFAVFDLGGGTLDFSFGMYRSAELMTEGFDEAIELFGTDGNESIGGESLIRRLSYWVFTADENKEELLSNRIIFERPESEPIPGGYGELIQSSPIAKANMWLMAEGFARPFFEGKEITSVSGDPVKAVNEDGTPNTNMGNQDLEIRLTNRDGEERVVNLTANTEVLWRKLEEEISKICGIFKAAADNTFRGERATGIMKERGVTYNPECVQVIMSGNASQHPLIKQNLKEIFGESNVAMVGETADTLSYGGDQDRYRVTPKSAVAIGLLKLLQMNVIEPKESSDVGVYQYYVAIQKKRKLEVILNKNSLERDWQPLGAFANGAFRIYFNGLQDEEHAETWKYTNLVYTDQEDRRMLCWIRPKGTREVEYVAVPLGAGNNPNKDENLYDDIYTVELK